MRRAAVALAVLLAGCESEQAAPPAGAQTLACATGGATQLSANCWAERSGEVLVIHHPDGGFRRFTVLTDGRGLAAADGASAAVTRLDGGLLEVKVEDDVYRVPVAVKGDAPAR